MATDPGKKPPTNEFGNGDLNGALQDHNQAVHASAQNADAVLADVVMRPFLLRGQSGP